MKFLTIKYISHASFEHNLTLKLQHCLKQGIKRKQQEQTRKFPDINSKHPFLFVFYDLKLKGFYTELN